MSVVVFFFQAEDGIRDLVRSRGLGDVYKRQGQCFSQQSERLREAATVKAFQRQHANPHEARATLCLLYTSDAADERSSVDLGGRRIIKKKKESIEWGSTTENEK